jgi:hypothetical protein
VARAERDRRDENHGKFTWPGTGAGWKQYTSVEGRKGITRRRQKKEKADQKKEREKQSGRHLGMRGQERADD